MFRLFLLLMAVGVLSFVSSILADPFCSLFGLEDSKAQVHNVFLVLLIMTVAAFVYRDSRFFRDRDFAIKCTIGGLIFFGAFGFWLSNRTPSAPSKNNIQLVALNGLGKQAIVNLGGRDVKISAGKKKTVDVMVSHKDKLTTKLGDGTVVESLEIPKSLYDGDTLYYNIKKRMPVVFADYSGLYSFEDNNRGPVRPDDLKVWDMREDPFYVIGSGITLLPSKSALPKSYNLQDGKPMRFELIPARLSGSDQIKEHLFYKSVPQ